MKIALSKNDMLKGEPIPNGWYKAEIIETSSKPSKDGESVNHVATCQIMVNGDERTIDARFNSKAIGFVKPFLAALENLTMAEFKKAHASGIEFDIDECKGGKLQIKVNNKPFEGREVSEVTDYAPYNYTVPF